MCVCIFLLSQLSDCPTIDFSQGLVSLDNCCRCRRTRVVCLEIGWRLLPNFLWSLDVLTFEVIRLSVMCNLQTPTNDVKFWFFKDCERLFTRELKRG